MKPIATHKVDECTEQDILDKGQPEVGATDWTKLIQTVGFPIVCCGAIAYFAMSTVDWERTKMLPALEATTKAIETNSEVLRSLPASFRREAKAEQESKVHN